MEPLWNDILSIFQQLRTVYKDYEKQGYAPAANDIIGATTAIALPALVDGAAPQRPLGAIIIVGDLMHSWGLYARGSL